jgi:hypothetical protein
VPVKRRKSKLKAFKITPEVVAAFEAGDEQALACALKLPPWHASPLWTDLAGKAHYGTEDMSVNQTRATALDMRNEILAALATEH